jgi:quinol monooxygenase YgiN
MLPLEELKAKKAAVDAAYEAYADSAAFKACFGSPEYRAFQTACVAYDEARKVIPSEELIMAMLKD